MKAFFVIKAIMMVFALVIVIGIIRGLKPEHVGKAFSALGIEQSPRTPTSQGPAPSKYSLCRNRIHALKWSDGRKIEESKNGLKMKWMAYKPAPIELGYVSMEKWLGKYCVLETEPVSAESAAQLTFVPLMTVEFIDKQAKGILRAGDVFKINGSVFRSKEFETALEELKQLATFE